MVYPANFSDTANVSFEIGVIFLEVVGIGSCSIQPAIKIAKTVITENLLIPKNC